MSLILIPHDKANHAIYGAAVALVAQIALFLALRLTNLDAHGIRPKDAGLAAAVAFGVGKEAVDAVINYRATGSFKSGPHGVEPMDAVATALGGAVVFASSSFG